jgi:hypothetical protein
MPTFNTHSYYFAMDILHVSLFLYGIIISAGGLIKAIFVFIFQRFFARTSYHNIFIFNQLFKFGCGMLELCLARGWLLAFGIPNTFLYVFIHFNELAEAVFIWIPLHIMCAKLIRPGTESTMMGVTYSMLLFNHYTVREYVGMAINQGFDIGVKKGHLDNYWNLVVIQACCCLIPLFYIYKIVPSNEECI